MAKKRGSRKGAAARGAAGFRGRKGASTLEKAFGPGRNVVTVGANLSRSKGVQGGGGSAR